MKILASLDEKERIKVNGADLAMLFDINDNDYTIDYENNPNTHYDLVTVYAFAKNENMKNFSKLFNFAGFHSYENQHKEDEYYPNTLIITPHYYQDENNYPKNYIFNDFLFNRTKAYYSQFPFKTNTSKWYFKGQKSYIIPTHPNPEIKKKIFVAPNKTHKWWKDGDKYSPPRKLKYRRKLVDLLISNYEKLGYIGNYDDNKNYLLYSHIEFPEINDIDTLESIKSEPIYNFWGYSPPHNEYYKNTFISIYTESVEFGNSVVITEKTFDPLIKGHFIFPFSAKNTIKRLREIGFMFPDFINYNYDTIDNSDLRYVEYCKELDRLMSLPINNWRIFWDENFDKVIYYNMKLFHTLPYDKINFKKYI